MKLLISSFPLAMFTDYAMGAFALFLALSILRFGKQSGEHLIFFRSWGWGFILLSLTVFLGGTLEGFQGSMSAESIQRFRIVLAALAGLASSFQVFGTVNLALKDSPLRSLLFGIWGASIAIYLVFLILHFSPGLKTPFTVFNTSAIISLFLWYFLREKGSVVKPILYGISAQLLAMLFYLGSINISSTLSASVIFNVFMTVGLYFYYRGITGGELWVKPAKKERVLTLS
jgi:hypothetical protein